MYSHLAQSGTLIFLPDPSVRQSGSNPRRRKCLRREAARVPALSRDRTPLDSAPTARKKS